MQAIEEKNKHIWLITGGNTATHTGEEGYNDLMMMMMPFTV